MKKEGTFRRYAHRPGKKATRKGGKASTMNANSESRAKRRNPKKSDRLDEEEKEDNRYSSIRSDRIE